MIRSDELPPGTFPKWDPAWQETRFAYEIEALAPFVGDSLRIDEALLQKGLLHLEFTWKLSDGTACDLEARYPDSFPYLRPQVFLRARPENFPLRHCSPNDGNLCLLGRDTSQWPTNWTLATLLQEQLEKALNGATDEDPQGEPIEVYWNAVGSTMAATDGSYILVDSSWDLQTIDNGKLTLAYSIKRIGDRVQFRGAVTQVANANGDIIAHAGFAIPADLQPGADSRRSTELPWKRVDRLAPPVNWKFDLELLAQLNFNDKLVDAGGSAPAFKLSIFLQKTELEHGKNGDSWLFSMLYGAAKHFKRAKPGHQEHSPKFMIIPTFRAGESDLGRRVPGVNSLREKTVAIIGLGAIGAPIALDMARNGCRKLILLDHDVVEPGNSIRWPLGASAWGRHKAAALKDHIELEYPWTSVQPVLHFIGGTPAIIDNNPALPGDADVLSAIVAEADIVIDATASSGPTRLLSRHCQNAKKMMVSAYATSSLKSGVVAVYHPEAGCPNCCEFAYQDETLHRPLGSAETDGLQQPPGCGELTFTGASFDLQELSLAAMRMAVDVLRHPESHPKSSIHTLALHDGHKPIPPDWTIVELPVRQECGCQS